MSLPGILTFYEKNFTAKIYVRFIAFMLLVSVSFTAFFVNRESALLKSKLLERGESLLRIMATTSMVGIFSANQKMLNSNLDGIYQEEDVLSVALFNSNGGVASWRERRKGLVGKFINRGMRERLEQSNSFSIEEGDTFDFWSPVFVDHDYGSISDLFSEEKPIERKKSGIIGFVKVALDKKGLNRSIETLLRDTLLISGLFLVFGFAAIFLISKRVTVPLKRLTTAVHALGKGDTVDSVPVETEDEVGTLAGAFNDMHDSLKQRELENLEMEKELRHSQKMAAIGTFTGGIAHNFHNILTTVIGSVYLIRMALKNNNPIEAFVDQISASATRATTLSKSLLAFSRKQMVQMKPVNINAVIHNRVLEILAPMLYEKVRIELISEENVLMVIADAALIQHVMINLVSNARDALPDGGVVTIHTKSVKPGPAFFKGRNEHAEKSEHYVVVSVIDKGEGMDEETKARIFEPFFTTKDVDKGTGLGLSIVYGIIQQHHGYIDVDSVPGEGTTFRIYLPMIPDKDLEGIMVESVKILKSGAEPWRGGSETVLIAEDDKSARMVLSAMITGAGYNVIEAVDGEDAVEKFKEHREEIQLLLLDVIMPKMNGKKAYDEIRKIRPDIKAFFLTGYTDDVIDIEGIRGADIIMKPVQGNDLLTKIRETLDRKS